MRIVKKYIYKYIKYINIYTGDFVNASLLIATELMPSVVKPLVVCMCLWHNGCIIQRFAI